MGNVFNQTLVGNAGANYLDGGGGADTLRGNGGNDTYIVGGDDFIIELGGGGTDTAAAIGDYALAINAEIETLMTVDNGATTAMSLTGNDFSQSIFGNAGANVLNGGGGHDLLQGFGGADTFRFTSPLGSGNVDTIADMATGVDRIELENAVFTGLPAGILVDAAFRIGTSAQDADDRILYDPNTGALFFDADGNGAGAAIQFATLAAGTPLTSSDFFVI